MAQLDPLDYGRAARAFTAIALIGLLLLTVCAPVVAMLVVSNQDVSPRWVEVGSIQQVPSNGDPELFPVVLSRRDAWTHRSQHVGFVYVRRALETDKILALSDVSPWIGGRVEFDEERRRFRCTCHIGEDYDFDGRRIGSNPAPRGLDSLDVVTSGDAIMVKWQRFRSIVADKISVD